MVENRVKAVREELGMTQDELSRKSGISRAMISSLEMQKKEDCKVSTMIAVAKALGKPAYEIFLSSMFTDVN